MFHKLEDIHVETRSLKSCIYDFLNNKIFTFASFVKNGPEFWETSTCALRKMSETRGGRLIVSSAISLLCEGVFVQRWRRRQKRVIGKLLEFSRLYRSRACRVGLRLEGVEEERGWQARGRKRRRI